ncbi:Uncharacterised protein [Vibrio cholerae]|nr:Uncharacterised protein [Vibrio cholerae]CSI36547.1 Uncharacterised protein [Vibrio cholerae]CSI48297.1 Uncharacterised protein [Vibrio cholerae]
MIWSTELSLITLHHFSSSSVLRGINTSSVPGLRISSDTTRPSASSVSATLTSPPSMCGVITTPSRVPQSCSVTTTSCATSTRRRVR